MRTMQIHFKCNHHACDDCCEGTGLQCPVCNCSTNYTRYSLIEDILTLLKSHKSSIVNSETALRDENTILKEKLLMLETSKEDHHKCAECEKVDSEQDMQLCKTCHELKFDGHEDVKKNALCAVRAIKKHIQKGHQIVDFYPYLSAYNFSSQSSKIGSKSEEFKSARSLLNDTFTRFNASSITVSESYNVLTDMAQRSKSTKNQAEIFEKMGKFIDKSKSIHGEADSDMKNYTAKLEEILAEIKEWYESRMKDCVDESEIIQLQYSEDFDENDTDFDA